MKLKSIKMKQRLFLSIFGITLIVASLIPWRLAIARYREPQPQAILTLGGGKDRELLTAKLAQSDPSLLIWVSSGSPNSMVREIFTQADIAQNRVYLDRRAVDTVTNFTTVVRDLKQHQIEHVYLVTSDFHMNRARAIAFWILGSHGIAFTSVSVPSTKAPESKLIVVRDACRAFFWLITGHTGASFKTK